MLRHIRVFAGISLLALPSLAHAQVPLSPGTAYTTTAIRLREKPFPTARALALLPTGTAVTVYSCEEGWCSAAASRQAGYLLEEFLTAEQPRAPPTAAGRGYINSDGL